MLDRWPSLDKCWFYTEVNIIYDLSVENNEILSIKKQIILIPTPFSRYLSCSKTNCSCLHASYGKWLYVRPSVILPTLKLTAQLAMKTMTIKPWPFHHSKLRWAFKYFFGDRHDTDTSFISESTFNSYCYITDTFTLAEEQFSGAHPGNED